MAKKKNQSRSPTKVSKGTKEKQKRTHSVESSASRKTDKTDKTDRTDVTDRTNQTERTDKTDRTEHTEHTEHETASEIRDTHEEPTGRAPESGEKRNFFIPDVLVDGTRLSLHVPRPMVVATPERKSRKAAAAPDSPESPESPASPASVHPMNFVEALKKVGKMFSKVPKTVVRAGKKSLTSLDFENFARQTIDFYHGKKKGYTCLPSRKCDLSNIIKTCGKDETIKRVELPGGYVLRTGNDAAHCLFPDKIVELFAKTEGVLNVSSNTDEIDVDRCFKIDDTPCICVVNGIPVTVFECAPIKIAIDHSRDIRKQLSRGFDAARLQFQDGGYSWEAEESSDDDDDDSDDTPSQQLPLFTDVAQHSVRLSGYVELLSRSK